MLIEALTLLTVRWPGVELQLEPGKPVDLPDDRARRLLERAAGKVRIVAAEPEFTLASCSRIAWESPLFGRLTGEVVGVRVDGWLEVYHPVTGTLVPIPAAWILPGEWTR